MSKIVTGVVGAAEIVAGIALTGAGFPEVGAVLVKLGVATEMAPVEILSARPAAPRTLRRPAATENQMAKLAK